MRFLFFVLFFLSLNNFAWAFFEPLEAEGGDCHVTLSSNSTSQLNCSDNDELTVSEGVSLSRTGTVALHGQSNENLKITNHGTIQSSGHHTIYLRSGVSPTIDNKSTGTIESTGGCCAIGYKSVSGTFTVTNAGNIISKTHGTIVNWGTSAAETNITNSGTIRMRGLSVSQSNVKALCAICAGGSSGTVTITNSGTIETIGDDRPAIYSNDLTTSVITNSGTISGHGTAKDILIADEGAGSATTTININKGATWNKGIDLSNTNSKIVLGSDNNRDVTVKIYNHNNLTIEDNTTGSNGYTLTTEDLDSGGSDNDGTLTILGENLEVEKNNQKYRAENTLTKMRSIFGAANYLGGEWPDNCTTVEQKETRTEHDETCNNRFVKLFHSYQKRDGVYDGSSSGVIGMLSPIDWKGYPIVSNLFVGYSTQGGDFDNGEFLGGDNFVLGLKNTFEHRGLRASFTPMIGISDLDVKDYDTDKVEKVTNDFLSEFAALNAKINKKIGTGDENYLNISVEGTYGLQRFPEYLSKFTDGDLSVDESIEQLLSGGFEVSYTEGLPGSFIIKPYFGVNLNSSLTDEIKITARNENSNVKSSQESWSGYHAGVSLTKKAKDINFDLDLMYGNEDGLINQIAAFSVTKSFGKSKGVKTSTKTDENIKLANIKIDEDVLEFGKLKEINEQIKNQNAKLKAENAKLKSLYTKAIEENKASKKMIVELLKENEKIKLEKEIFKNKLLENENKKLKQQIEDTVADKGINKFATLLFVTVLLLLAYGMSTFILSIFKYSFKK
tara:strand:- start:541 stop:2892 length:2352 start_codon:yes stop_codon:yes gene_type:complete